MALSCHDSDLGLVKLKFTNGKQVEFCAFSDCYSTRYKGDPDKRVSFNIPSVLTANFVHVRRNRYRLTWRTVEPNPSFGQKYITLNMICR